MGMTRADLSAERVRRRAAWSLLGLVLIVVVALLTRPEGWALVLGWCGHRLWMWKFDEPKLGVR